MISSRRRSTSSSAAIPIPSKLAVEGGSNGGLLMGAFLTQRPDLARAVVARVGIHDMLRVELDPNGQFNVTEFGTVKDPEQFKALLAYSPFHHVRDGVKYPAVLLTTGENDGRVNPAQSRKMAARLQAATGLRPADPLPQHRQRRPRHRQRARRNELPSKPTCWPSSSTNSAWTLRGGRFSEPVPRGRFVLVLVVVLVIGGPEGGDYDYEDDEEDAQSGFLRPSLRDLPQAFRALTTSRGGRNPRCSGCGEVAARPAARARSPPPARRKRAGRTILSRA